MAKWLLHWPTPPTKPSSPLKSWAGQDVGASLASLFRLHRDGPGNGRFLGDDPLDQHDLLDLIAIISSVAAVYTHYHCGQGKGHHIPQQDGPILQFHSVPGQSSEFEADTAPGKFVLRDLHRCAASRVALLAEFKTVSAHREVYHPWSYPLVVTIHFQLGSGRYGDHF